MSARWVRTFLVMSIVFAVSSTLPVQAAKAKSKAKAKEAPPPAAVEPAASDFPDAALTVGFQTRDSETEGLGDLLIPVWNPGGTGLLFVNPRTAITDDDEEEGNLGVGYRQLLPKLDLILGVNAYYDYRDVDYAHYDQWGVGFELLSTWLDARFNYYDPDDDRYVVASETETTTSQSVQTREGWGDPYGDDHEVKQDYTLTQILTTTATTKTYEQYEQPLGGYDWEIGLRLPIRCDALEARVFGGYYDFDRDFGDDAQGWKVRTELRVLSSFFIDGGLYENEDLTGSDWFAGARVSVPLDLAKIAQGRNPFGGAKDRLAGAPRDAAARLTDMVMRDPQIRLEQSKFIENKQLEQVETSSESRSDSQTYVLLDDVQFVDGDAPAGGNGRDSRPFNTIQDAANAVFGTRNVYVYNASGPYNENVVLLPDTTLWGSGNLIPGYGGRSFGSGVRPVVDGLSLGPSITMADRTTVRGFRVQNTDMGGPDQMIIIPGLPTFNIARAGIYGANATDLAILDNVVRENEVGVLLARTGDFNLTFEDNRIDDNEADGMDVWTAGGSTFAADVSDSAFRNNGGAGLLLYAAGFGGALTEVSDSEFSGNAAMGLNSIQMNSEFAMSMLSGINATRNGGGLVNQQNNNVFSLLNVSDAAADDNVGFGIMSQQSAMLAAVSVFGMPEGLDASVDAVASLFGLTLPDEVGQFLAPSGAVSASGNGGSGIQSIISVQDGLALGAYLDVTANDNQGSGVFAMQNAINGVAVGLAGSTENLSEIVALGTQIGSALGVDLPLSLAGGGQMQCNGNLGTGFSMQSFGDDAAVNAVVGLEANGNAGPGVFLGTSSDYLSVGALARVNASGNLGAGVLFDTYALDEAAVGILADVNASGNGDGGITASVDCPDGSAAFVALSTDAIRPLAALLGDTFLDGPITLPGDPFGPIVTSGNDGNGFSVTVTGDGFAMALLLDAQADNNSANGFDVSVTATNGPSIAALVSSDLLYGLINDMDVLPEPIEFDPIGRISASGNGSNGVHLVQSGTSGAYGVLVGLDADGNALDGINASQESSDGDTYAIFVDTDAANNGDDGIDLSLAAAGYAITAMIFPDMDQNGDAGIHVTQTSVNADAYALLCGGDAWDNDGVGLWYSLNAANGDAAACVTDTFSDENGARGAHFAITAGDDAALLVGTNALPLFDLEFTGFLGGDVLNFFWDAIPQGGSSFYGNGAGGLQADLTSTGGDVWLDVDGADASNNTNNGFNASLTAQAGSIFARFSDNWNYDNGGNGINVELNGAGGTANLGFLNLRTIGNDANGISVVENYNGAVEVGGERIVSENNLGNGVRLVMSGLGGAPTLDFGGGTLGSLGNSSIFGNGNRDFRYNNGGGATVMAENNWWGVGGGTFAGSIDRVPAQGSDPNPLP